MKKQPSRSPRWIDPNLICPVCNSPEGGIVRGGPNSFTIVGDKDLPYIILHPPIINLKEKTLIKRQCSIGFDLSGVKSIHPLYPKYEKLVKESTTKWLSNKKWQESKAAVEAIRLLETIGWNKKRCCEQKAYDDFHAAIRKHLEKELAIWKKRRGRRKVEKLAGKDQS